MEKNLNILFIIFSILYLIQSVAPPKLKPIPKIQVVIPTIVNPKNLVQKAIKRLDSEQESELVIEQSTFNTTYHKDYEIIEQQLILKAKNLKESQYYSKWSYITSSEGISLDDINDLCKVMTADGSESKTKCTSTHNIENNRLRFSYETKVYNGESLIIIHKYKR